MSDEAIKLDGKLSVIHREIDECDVCSTAVTGLQKPASMVRGGLGSVMIVGKGPGKTEVEQRRAFSGPAGRKLESWLRQCVPNPDDVRAGIYFTSVTKCLAPAQAFPILLNSCGKFLDRQILAVQPRLIITLGEEAYRFLAINDDSYPTALCRLYDSSQSLFFTRFNHHYRLMVWPHPSGLNRWHNEPENVRKLEQTFDVLRPNFASLMVGPSGSPS